VLERLFPRSGEQAGHHGPREASSEAEVCTRGRKPRAGWELARGAKAFDRGGSALKGERTLMSPRGGE
jgi:hypothetical protein